MTRKELIDELMQLDASDDSPVFLNTLEGHHPEGDKACVGVFQDLNVQGAKAKYITVLKG